MTDTLLTSLHKVLDKPATPPATPPTQRDIFDDEYYYDRYQGRYDYGGYNYGQRSTTRGYSLTSSRRVLTIDQDGTEKAYTVPYDCEGWFDIAQHVWPTTDNTMRVPLSHCEFSYGDPTFNACVYTATNDYMQARWGRKLDDSDRRWLAAHPLSTDGGVPQEYTMTCVDQLVTPYGLRVSRVRLRRGSLVLGDAVMAWIQALGCNPFALADRTTSNAEAAARMGLSVEQADALWRVEFSDDPLPCSIVGERGWSNGTGVSTGALGGHARYLAPRARANDWFVSVQLDQDTAVTHLVTPPNPEYVPRKGSPTLLLSCITGPDGKRIAEKVNTKWQACNQDLVVVEPPVEPARPTATTVETPYTPLVDDEATRYCLMCGTTATVQVDFVPNNDICLDCLDEAWQAYECPHCQCSFSRRGAPDPVAATETVTTWQCPDCKGEIEYTIAADGGDLVLDDLCYVLASGLPRRSFPDADDPSWVLSE